MGELCDSGYLKIGNEQDRATVAQILYRNGYSVKPARKRKNGKAFEYYVAYRLENPDVKEGTE